VEPFLQSMMVKYTYDPHTGVACAATAGLDAIDFLTDYLGRHTRQLVRMPEMAECTVRTTVSPAGRPLDQTGADGVLRTFDYDIDGRLSRVKDDHVDVALDYDALSRLSSRTAITHGATMVERDTYGASGRLSTRSWDYTTSGETRSHSMALTWRNDGKLSGRHYRGDAGESIREEVFDYDVRGRLTHHHILQARDGAWPRDETGREYLKQAFAFDAVDNLTRVVTTFVDGGMNETTLHYDARDPDRVVRVTETAGTDMSMAYDPNGSIVRLHDRHGTHAFSYDAAGRLTDIRHPDGASTEYRHGPGDRITGVIHDGRLTNRIFQDGRLACTVTPTAEIRRFVRVDGDLVAETEPGTDARTQLVGSDMQGSTVVEGKTVRTYGTYGIQTPVSDSVVTAFAGELPETGTGWYVLGRRVYIPALRRFTSPDASSPFDDGGLNRYAYCAGDPVNRIDPTGESWWEIGLTIFGITAAIAAVVVSGGAALAAAGAAGSVASAVSTPSVVSLSVVAALDVVSLVAEGGSAIATIAGDETLSSVFGTMALTTGIMGAATGLASLGKTVAKAASGRGMGLKHFVGWNKLDRRPHSGDSYPRVSYGADGVPGNETTTGTDGARVGPRDANPVWHSKSNNGATHYAAASEINFFDIRKQLTRIVDDFPSRREWTNLYLYGGAHGRPEPIDHWDAETRMHKFREKWIHRNFTYNRASLTRMARKKGYRLVYVPMGRIDVDEYERTLRLPGVHLHGQCFGAADARVMLASGMRVWSVPPP